MSIADTVKIRPESWLLSPSGCMHGMNRIRATTYRCAVLVGCMILLPKANRAIANKTSVVIVPVRLVDRLESLLGRPDPSQRLLAVHGGQLLAEDDGGG